MFAEIGIGLTGFGFVLTFLGVLFFFDKGLLAMGNVSVATSACMNNSGCRRGLSWLLLMRSRPRPRHIEQPCFKLTVAALFQILFVAGVAMTIGAQATFRFFLRKKNQRVSSAIRWRNR